MFAGFPAVISIMKVLLDLDAASLTPGNRREARTFQQGKKAPAFAEGAGAAFRRSSTTASFQSVDTGRSREEKADQVSVTERHP